MVGERITHYRIEEELGRGGMGVVYRAHDERLRRSVALKVLPDEIASQSERRARILAEARAASALNHPGIMTIYEVGEDGDRLFIVMELVSGKTLRTMIAEGPCEVRTLGRLGSQIADILAAAHAMHVVHGDVKPENIIVQPDSRVKLLDFGIARQMAVDSVTATVTNTSLPWVPDSQVAGTIAYMSPEQLRGETSDGRADLFSLGVVLYEMASGTRPFVGANATALVSQILHAQAPALSAVAELVPSELNRIVHKLLEKDPNARYQSAREVAVDLTNLTRDLEVGAVLPAAVLGKRAIAVLPFKLLTPNPNDEYLSAALADAVVNHLSGLPDLLVRPTSTVMRYAKQAVDPLVAARELNVQVIVDGSIQKIGDKLRVHIQARDAADGSSLLSAKHDSEMTDLFGLQDTIAESLARALGSSKKNAEVAPATRPTRNSMAYELYLRAMERLMHLTRWDTRTAIEMLENAVELDPKFADAWARLAQACWNMAAVFEPGPAWIKRAEQAIRKALLLDRNNAEAIASRGQVLWTAANKFQNRLALRALQQAVRLNPGCIRARVWSGCILLHIGLLEEGKHTLTESLASNPDDPFTLVFLGQIGLYSAHYDEGLAYHDRAIALDPGNIWANLFAATIPLYQQDLKVAEQRIKSSMAVVGPDPLLIGCEALLMAQRGEVRKATQFAQKALKSSKAPLSHTHHMWHVVAAAYSLVGKKLEALKLLEMAAELGLPNYPVFGNDPHFRGLHDHPRFLRLMATLKKEWTVYEKEFGAARAKAATK